MSERVERFSHGPDGFWRDPDGLYVEHSDYDRMGEAADQECARAAIAEIERRAEERAEPYHQDIHYMLDLLIKLTPQVEGP